MPAGCDFICENTECPEYKKGFVITGPWPMGDIDLVIETPHVKSIKSFQSELILLRDKGRKYACINYPNVKEIKTVAYRVNKWCNTCFCIWSYDVILDADGETFEDAFLKSDVPKECPKCKGHLMNFDDIIENGINCPHCKKEMESSRWFSNE